MRSHTSAYLFILSTLLPVLALGQAPGTISFQGYLTDDVGAPLNSAKTAITFKLYEGSQEVWSEVHSSVSVSDGVFDVLLGSIVPLDTMRFDRPLFLGIKVDTDPEMSPRVALAAAAYARALPGFHTVRVIDGSATGYNVIGGGFGVINESLGPVHGAFIGGGGENDDGDLTSNVVHDDFGTIGGGGSNQAARLAFIGGGWGNEALGEFSVVGGGDRNEIPAGAARATIAGGFQNYASQSDAAVGGGYRNRATGLSATVAGGIRDSAYTYSSVGGGYGNNAAGTYVAIAGGYSNRATGNYSVIAGGQDNHSSGQHSTIGGGFQNSAVGNSTVAGGNYNDATALYSVIGGGYSNEALETYAAIGGGGSNLASGDYATIPGGSSNTASGDYSLAAGWKAEALHGGTFVWADSASSTGIPFSSTEPNQFLVRAGGGIGLGTETPDAPVDIAGGNNWDTSNSEGDLKIGDDTYRLAIGVSLGGAGAGNVRLTAKGGLEQIILGGSSQGVLRVDPSSGVLPHSNEEFSLGSSSNLWTEVWASNGTIQMSDRRLKSDITPIPYGLEEVLDLNPVSYRWKEDPEAGRRLGLVAQEASEVIPEVVTGSDDSQEYLGMQYSELVPLLIKAIQDLESINQAQNDRIQHLEAALGTN